MKAKGRPFGQAFGHSINDPNNWCYPLVWMWGGDGGRGTDGRTVVLNSKNTIEAVKFNNVLWKEVFDEGGLAWDDSNNNRAFLSSEISLTGNAPSIYVAARQKFPDVYKGTNHGHYPAGPGRPLLLAARVELVRDEVRQEPEGRQGLHPLLHGPRAFEPYFETMDTFGIPGTQAYRDHALWKKDPEDRGVPGDAAGRPAGRPRRTARPQGDRGAVEVHHRRHVRQGHPGHDGPRTRWRGRRGAEEDYGA